MGFRVSLWKIRQSRCKAAARAQRSHWERDDTHFKHTDEKEGRPVHAPLLTCLLSTSGETAPAARRLITATCLNRPSCPRPAVLEHACLCYRTSIFIRFCCCLTVLWFLSQQRILAVSYASASTRCQIKFDWFTEQTPSRCSAWRAEAKAQGRCLFRGGLLKDQRLAMFAQSCAERTD